MQAGTALLSVFLAGPALAAPPGARPAADANAAIMARINAADPALTQSPTPIENLLDVAELAERRLAAATDLDDVGELLTHVGTAREIAHGRTGAPDHLCRLLDAAGSVLARAGLPANLRTEALDFTNRAHATLSAGHPGHTCVPESHAELLPVVRKPAVAWTRPPAEQADRPKLAPMTLAGGVLLGTATALTLGLVGVRVHRGRAGDELGGIRSEVEAAGGKTLEQDERIAELQAIKTWTRSATVGLAVSAAVLGAVGVGLVVAGAQRQRTQQARLVPYGGPQGPGIALVGRF
jgi:hypothetical protein